ncbi:MAG: hypothetical protein WAN65_13325, partial [Candidatus Sulfotelmatobacter sp.]
ILHRILALMLTPCLLQQPMLAAVSGFTVRGSLTPNHDVMGSHALASQAVFAVRNHTGRLMGRVLRWGGLTLFGPALQAAVVKHETAARLLYQAVHVGWRLLGACRGMGARGGRVWNFLPETRNHYFPSMM